MDRMERSVSQTITEKFIRKHIRRILLEAGSEEGGEGGGGGGGGSVERGRVGRGGVKAAVKEAGARATKEPDQLMKDLGVSGGGGGDDVNQIYKVITQSINKNDLMGDAYAGAKGVESGGNKGVRVQTGDLSPRDAAYYMTHVLVGAQNAGMLSLKEKWVIDVEGGGVIIHAGEKGGWK